MCRASKQYAFMYEDSNLDRAWTDPDVYNTRSRGGRARDSRSDSKGQCCRKGQRPCPGEYVPLFAALVGLLLVLLFGQRTRYCTTAVAHT